MPLLRIPREQVLRNISEGMEGVHVLLHVQATAVRAAAATAATTSANATAKATAAAGTTSSVLQCKQCG